ncbi:sterol 3-beta-glucosyltransferase UGT80B1 [Hordeum vulgare subsp. vulgare]|uniref:sterol 3beta-glucosyltransferase n=1 Tax=Hordeum vulgare subsp. vulgare TaxID=112509 RepID=A0A8I6XS05_HORVV|nr:sterol 3-beta-glucosyltransferase UGT80B1 [Hordeum vulgare subsp. vulgare]
MGRNSETSVAGEGSGSGDLRRRRGGRDGAGASSSSSSSFAEGTREFVLSSMDERFSGSVDADGFPSSRREGFGHSKSTTATSGRFRGQDHAFVRSYSDRLLKCDLTLDMLSENDKMKIIEKLVKIQKDGTLEVDVIRSALVASELSEIDAFGSVPCDVEEVKSGFSKSVPKLKIAILVVGTRGDVQPFIALAKRLQEFGHHVRLASHVNFRTFVKSAGVDFYPLGGDPRIMAQYMTKNKGFLMAAPTEISVQRKQVKEIIFSLLPACTEPDLDTGIPFRAQAIIANPPALGHLHIAEALGVPLHIFFTFPWTPTNEFPHPLARTPQSATYRLSYLIVDLIIWWGTRGFINDFRKKLNLSPIAYFSTYHGSISHLPTGYMWSPHLMPKPNDWGSLVDVVGYCFLNLGTKYQPPPELSQWLEQGSKPIYIGFGSMPLDDEKKVSTIILDALRETGQRGIISRGWGDLGSFSEVPGDVFILEDCPHDWLFPRCTAVVHHGGAGTTAAGLIAGCPTTVVPFFGDQFFWGEIVHARGVGPVPIRVTELTTEALSNAIRFMLDPEVKSRSMELAIAIGNEDGVAAAVDSFHRHLPSELPLTPPPAPVEEERLDLLQLLARYLEKCCLPFNS